MTVTKGVGSNSAGGFKSLILEAAREPVGDLPFEVSDQLRYMFGDGRPLRYSLDDYWVAPGGEGPLGSTWHDKPHRIVYDLIAALVYYSRRDGGEQR